MSSTACCSITVSAMARSASSCCNPSMTNPAACGCWSTVAGCPGRIGVLHPQFTTPQQPLELVAQVYVPPGASFQLQGDVPDKSWPRLITLVEPQRLWQQLGRGGLAYEVRLEPGPASYLAEWPVVAMSPDKHTGYAVQWFALAAALCGLYLYFGWRNAREQHDEHNHESPQQHS